MSSPDAKVHPTDNKVYPHDKEVVDQALDRVSSIDEKNIEGDGSSYIDGSEGVTQHDLDTLRHVADTLPYTAWLVLIVEFAERLGPYLRALEDLLTVHFVDGVTTALQTSSTTTFVRPFREAQGMAVSSSMWAMVSPVPSDKVFRSPLLSVSPRVVSMVVYSDRHAQVL